MTTLPKPYYQDSAVTLYHGDCREIVSLLGNGPVVTDPPYNIGYHYAGYSDNLPDMDYLDMLLTACRPPCVIIHYIEDLFRIPFESYPQKVVAWVYPSNTARQWRAIGWWECEPDFTLDGQDYKNPNDKRIAERISNGERARLYDWWHIDQVKNIGAEKTEHPCQIPLAVMHRIIKITTGDLIAADEPIIDPFAGSGTTGRACKDLGRKCTMIEREERYCEIAARRMGQEVFDL